MRLRSRALTQSISLRMAPLAVLSCLRWSGVMVPRWAIPCVGFSCLRFPGYAATSVKIAGVQHEFSTVEHVKEDVTEIILNIKELIVRLHCDEDKLVTIEAEGPCEIKAGDIICDSDVEILNPELHIATVGEGGSLNMQLTLSHGRGYVSAEQNKRELPPEIGLIPIDSIYTPVIKVNYFVDATRVGQITNYDKLTIEVTTNKTITAKEALSFGAKIMSEPPQLVH